ncbi:hypothetical protein [Roseateles koreensis]|uniref:Uncharacterized protein n=1 Tax=Roseateles koreensis TaxID=2987526 RepID=A0ABT5KTG1_9BURK|nr:hypothetical protein [Roseateles koreensis]MDC8786106.1 hypothetical protein [Roseateles koreensis]
MSDFWKTANDYCESLYADLSTELVSGYDAGVAKLKDIAGGAENAGLWVWHALQGDWNDERTVGQIAADAVLGMVPFVGQLLCLRDLIANAKKILEDARNSLAWVALVLTLIALFPVLGAPAKGAARIIFLYIRKFDGKVAPAVEAAMQPVLMFLRDPKVQRILGTAQIDKVLKTIATELRSLKGQLTAARVLAQLDELISAFKAMVAKLKVVLPQSQSAWLLQALSELERVRLLAEKPIQEAISPVQKILDEVAARLELEAAKPQAALHAPSNAKTVHSVPESLHGIDPRNLSIGKKGLFGEIISDHFMETAGHKSLMDEGRRVRDLQSVPRGRGIDGVYQNATPPPPYIVTETKYRTEAGLYIDSDGTASTQLLSTTKGSKGRPGAKQMTDEWIRPRLADEFSRALSDKIKAEKYERWLMIVGPSGKVEQITKLDGAANAIGAIKP